jgi:hypothetical protein
VEPGEEGRIRRDDGARGGARGDYVAIRDVVEALNQTTEPFARRIMDHALTEALAQRRLEEL